MTKRIPKPIAIISRQRRDTQTPYQKIHNRWTWEYTLFDVANQVVLGTHNIEWEDSHVPDDATYTNESDVCVSSLAQQALRLGYLVVARVNGGAAEASQRFLKRAQKHNEETMAEHGDLVGARG